ncbi:hypothetical protein [Paenibacillus maysiensis]|uniref:hypothetical protein n=1 Tax=Paenibacillus maysiensis TaxID=1155954 RepID=UPI0004715421|nr:hypothetical protein [Paenibacillus maysiensis]
MTQDLAEKIISNYVEKAHALRINTVAIRGVDPLSPEGKILWADRNEIYINWDNAMASLRELPIEYSARILCEIEQLPAI